MKASAAVSLRADAARNVAQIRAAAIAAFRGRGLSTPLEEIALAAGVSKATIYNRFGGREGLIDAVIGDLVAAEMDTIMGRARAVGDPWRALVTYVGDRRDLQFREPAFTDALLMTYPNSPRLVALANAATDTTVHLLRRGHDAGVLRPGFTAADLYYADVANGLALRALGEQTREDYDRRTRFFIDSLASR
ncbi:TetR/AcrR family transcriptional regulator [Actinoplanes sp. KI2]|uniref:TetR/AcrR family transcriptional regulator n=1 Tax=Actinoplanes sp. KI2 TaxID=2983315 RepID=UPI0021D576FA|nr:TetR/AcrR family transcriptional regulator [Actinoplanes sp. KI2]MCU7726554.1 TetR/AcrR family transcriptional regulator [Actinoplanes sp. KI2]